MLKYKFTKDGGFVAGETDTGVTAYAYPGSPYAVEAVEQNPRCVAVTMLAGEGILRTGQRVTIDYDKQNWQLLEDDQS